MQKIEKRMRRKLHTQRGEPRIRPPLLKGRIANFRVSQPLIVSKSRDKYDAEAVSHEEHDEAGRPEGAHRPRH
ncbi:hypothetical protein RSW84_30195, partial [Escherichia coli]|uniref:hypothetical protein n=1 Tax=Escherichia coli TaxID=562 RepID=UPI0028DFC3B0